MPSSTPSINDTGVPPLAARKAALPHSARPSLMETRGEASQPAKIRRPRPAQRPARSSASTCFSSSCIAQDRSATVLVQIAPDPCSSATHEPRSILFGTFSFHARGPHHASERGARADQTSLATLSRGATRTCVWQRPESCAEEKTDEVAQRSSKRIGCTTARVKKTSQVPRDSATQMLISCVFHRPRPRVSVHTREHDGSLAGQVARQLVKGNESLSARSYF